MTTNRTRQFVAVMMLAGALCVDRVAAPASGAGPQMIDMARRLAGRLSGSLGGRARVASLEVHARSMQHVTEPVYIFLRDRAASPGEIRPQAFHPFQFRLPPPIA